MLNIKSCQDSVNWILANRLLINDHNVTVINTKTSLIAGAFGINSTIWPINKFRLFKSTTIFRKRGSIYSRSRNSAYL